MAEQGTGELGGGTLANERLNGELGTEELGTTEFSRFTLYTIPLNVKSAPNAAVATGVIEATQAQALASMNNATAIIDNDSWRIVDASGESFVIDMVELNGGPPQFIRGEEIERNIVFNSDIGGTAHETEYENFRDKFNEYLTEDTIRTVQTIKGEPHFTQNINAQAETESFLIELYPNPSMAAPDPYWVVLTDVQDNTRQVGETERLGIKMYPVAPIDEGDRDTIEAEYEVE